MKGRNFLSYALLSLFLANDASAKTREFANVEISGNDIFFKRTVEAMKYLRDTDLDTYHKVLPNIKEIRNHKKFLGTYGRTGIIVNNGTVSIGDPTANNSREWYASVLVHESCHVDLYKAKKPHAGEDAERTCLEKQNKFLVKTKEKPIDIDKLMKTNYWTKRDYY